MRTTKHDLTDTIEVQRRAAESMKSHSGLVPTVYVGKVSARRYFVGINYQPAELPVGAAVTLPHPEGFVGPVVKV